MYYGTIENTHWGLKLKVDGYESWRYVGYTRREAERLYREQNGLKYKRIEWHWI